MNLFNVLNLNQHKIFDMKLTPIFILTLVSFIAYGQRATPDEIQTSHGSLIIQPIQHSTLALSWNNKTIYVDPNGGAKVFDGIQPPDLILITDIHGDHMSTETLNVLNTSKTIFVVPKAVAEKLSDSQKKQAVIINNGEKTNQLGIEVNAIPMYNLPEASDSRHPKGRGNGYVLNIGGKNVYISGDTEDIMEMRALKNIDIAFVCMNMPYTMDIQQAASAVLEFKPKIVYPFHYRGSDTEAFKKLVNDGNASIDVRLRNWYPETK